MEKNNKDESIFDKSKSFLLKYPLIFILTFSALIRIGYLLLNYPLWWDSHVYIGIGKYIFSNGQLGIWESFRPLIWPVILGIIWKLHLNPFIIGKLLDLILSIIVIYLTYRIANTLFSKTIALWSAIICSLTPLFIIFTGLILTEPLAIALGLWGIYVIISTFNPENQSINRSLRLFFAGLLLGLSFLTKFPQGIWFGSTFLILLFQKEQWKQKIKTILSHSSGFLLIVIPYLWLNYHIYGNPFQAFIEGSKIVETSTWLYGTGLTFYITEFFFTFPIYLFSGYALYVGYKEKIYHKSVKKLLFLIPLLTILYFLYVPRKETRYLVTILPFLAILSAYAIIHLYNTLKQHSKPLITPSAFIILTALLIILSLPDVLYIEQTPIFDKEIKTAIDQYNITGTILTSDPAFVSFLDHRIVTLDGIKYAPIVYQRQKKQYQLLFLNDCDLPCPPQNKTCTTMKQTFIQQIKTENTLIFQKTFKNCTYSLSIPDVSKK